MEQSKKEAWQLMEELLRGITVLQREAIHSRDALRTSNAATAPLTIEIIQFGSKLVPLLSDLMVLLTATRKAISGLTIRRVMCGIMEAIEKGRSAINLLTFKPEVVEKVICFGETPPLRTHGPTE
ncbi:hypothetical protein A3H10_02935 [Candidatus Uhrbacteria bacterium RIFCSPLOWO2_12_FULL_46_10]|uniref:Uncharacterized protein n=1 Tax=Candidatus Uhrbacteria bacterium RIFCSPLOWO2_01_FULL_47_25 TaxID=1802402 RepID=A0A1F7UW59_9BACT|nr:MAG: hypothetical protein UX68_C0017G0015 [Parcubacteria group bacterium GW2011_GWA2_46_9]OGL59657.1 MAG: hypothetical protein A2752_04930 [Candidatus Uhrbacteria bacterium RIFCSPHIGHO2_01_FULL_46_23]OGL68052.1 MAG: hypothetical protein A3D60_02875 [Candidatus Uhrbacteria bacterium RIFCSPHIGHO2_02_FULL_47_29]OGL76228.1 MAG: hypothetical protein A3E96_03915 [Candidatus Uhrbacteria bacterium RIFCSPHIGHO2_12_FULL_46_13]OGL82505.1 MAG: hypothetical protein A2936_03735 [Candidatus Uhrbacteria bac